MARLEYVAWWQKSNVCEVKITGAEDRGRTDMRLPSLDFETSASANSATPAL